MKFCLGKIRSSPWSELDGLQPETKIINEQLGSINMKGFLTINSQPAVNGAKSDSPSVGNAKYLFVNVIYMHLPVYPPTFPSISPPSTHEAVYKFIMLIEGK